MRLGEQRDEPLMRLGGEPDVRVEPIDPRELGGERREAPEMLGDLGTEPSIDRPSRAANGNRTVT